MAYATLTPIAISAASQQYTAGAKLRLPRPMCANGIAPTLSNVVLTQVYSSPTTQSTTGTTTTVWYQMTGYINYVPVGCTQQIQVPFNVSIPAISFVGTAGQLATVTPTIDNTAIVNGYSNNNCVYQLNIAVIATFAAKFA